MRNLKHLLSIFLITSLAVGINSCSGLDADSSNGDNTGDGPSFGGGANSGSGDAIAQGQTLLGLFNELISQQGANVPRQKIYLVAHRASTHSGRVLGCPDNSIPAIKKAIEVGADMLELDVRTTSDGKLILMHDESINATTNGSGYVSKMTLEQIRSYDMERNGTVYKENGQSVKVPTLEEALQACKGKVYVNLDLKDVVSPSKLVRTIADAGMQGQVMLYCSGADAIEYQYKDQTIAVHPFIGSAGGVDQYASCPGAKLFQYDISVWYSGQTLAKEVRAKGYLTYSNILDYDSQIFNGNYSALDKFIASETDFCQTDHCEVIHEYLKNKGLR